MEIKSNLWQSFTDYCKIFMPDQPFEKQLKGFIRRYPTMIDYEYNLRRRNEHERSLGHES